MELIDVTREANKRMFFLVLLKPAKVPTRDIISFDHTCIRPVLEYCAPLYHHALSEYLSDDLERIQKRTLLIISPGLPYVDNLPLYNISSLKDRRILWQWNKLFELAVPDSAHKLHPILPPKNASRYNLRNQRELAQPKMRTKRFSNRILAHNFIETFYGGQL